MHLGVHLAGETQETAREDALVHPSVHPVPPGEQPTQRLETRVRDFIGSVRTEFAEELSRDPKALRAAVLRLVRNALPIRRGRPNDPRLDAAMRLLEQGKTVREILRLQTRGFERLDAYGRYLAEKGLRTAIARRRRKGEGQPTSPTPRGRQTAN
jgi:hypothetical protein